MRYVILLGLLVGCAHREPPPQRPPLTAEQQEAHRQERRARWARFGAGLGAASAGAAQAQMTAYPVVLPPVSCHSTAIGSTVWTNCN